MLLDNFIEIVFLIIYEIYALNITYSIIIHFKNITNMLKFREYGNKVFQWISTIH